MQIRNNWFFMLWKAVLVIVCGYGLSYHMTAGRWGDFNYYTVLSNTVCLLYFLTAFALNARRQAKGKRTVTWRPKLEAAVTFCISVTFLIYHFVLRPEAFRMGNGGDFYSVLNMVQHYAVPLMTIGDWLLFCPKGRLRRTSPLTWLLIPLAYFLYILIRAPFAGDIPGTSSPYPYGFIDIQRYGIAVVARNAGLALIGMLALGYLLYGIDRGLTRLRLRCARRRSAAPLSAKPVKPTE